MEIERDDNSNRKVISTLEYSSPRQQQQQQQQQQVEHAPCTVSSSSVLLPPTPTVNARNDESSHRRMSGVGYIHRDDKDINFHNSNNFQNSGKDTLGDSTTSVIPPGVTVVTTVIRYSMTLLLVLFISAAILSIRSTQQYSLIVIVIWIVLTVIFASFCYMIDETILQMVDTNPTCHRQHRRQQRQRTVFHPLIHTFHNYIQTGMINFVDDCRTEYHSLHTMITNNNDDDRNLYHTPPTDATNYQNMSAPPTSPRNKTRLFRILVQPILHLHWRKRHRIPPTPAPPLSPPSV